MFLGNEPGRSGIIDWNESFRRSRELMQKVGLKESPNTLITNIGVGKQQLVEIAKALSKKVKLLILDEPTASLNEADSTALLNLLLEFKKQGMTSILISHKLNETGEGRRLDHRAARRVDRRDHRLPRRAGQREPHHQEHGRTRDDGTLSASRLGDRRRAVLDPRLARRAPAACGPRGGQGREPAREARRGGRNRGPHGRGAHGTRHERVRSGLWPQHQRRGDAGRALGKARHDRRRDRRTASPMSPRIARCSD